MKPLHVFSVTFGLLAFVSLLNIAALLLPNFTSRNTHIHYLPLHRDFSYIPVHHPPNQKYLTYSPGGGISMQKRCLCEALMFAKILNRTLVVPNFLTTYEGKDRGLDFEAIVDLEFLRGRMEMLHVPIVVQNQAPTFDNSDVHVTGPLSVAQTAFLTPENVSAMFAPYSDKKVLAFMWLFSYLKYDSDEERYLYQVVRASVRSPPALRDEVSAWKNALFEQIDDSAKCQPHVTVNFESVRHSYVCLHLRVEKDFEEVFKRPPQFLDASMVRTKLLGQMKRMFGPVGVKTLYIAGGSADRMEIKAFFHGVFPCVLSKSDVAPTNSTLLHMEELDTRRAIVDKEVCRQASVFVGNRYSTFSEDIVDWRMRHGSRDVGKYPWISLDYSGMEDQPMTLFCTANSKQMWGVECEE